MNTDVRKRYMKPVRIILVGLMCGVIATAHADIASVQYVQSIISSLDKGQVQPNWNQTDSTAADFIQNKPAIPTVNDGVLTIQKNGTTIDTFSANASGNKTVNITVPTNAVDIDAVPMTRTINNKDLAANITLAAGDIALTNYTKPTTGGSVAATDTVNQAIGKLERNIEQNIITVDTLLSNTSTNPVQNSTITNALADKVPNTRTVNNKDLTENITLTGADVAVTGYTKPATTSAIVATDTVNQAIGKLEKALDSMPDGNDYVPTTRTVNGHALSADVTVTKGDVGLSNVQNVDTTNAANITSGTMDVARLPVGTTSTTVSAGDDVRFNTVSTTQPSGTPPTGQAFIWFN